MRAIDAKAWLLLGPWLCAFSGCVSAREADNQGKASFISGAPSASLDYQAAIAGTGGAGGSGGAGGIGTMPVAGMTANPAAGSGGTGGAAGTSAMAGAGGAAGAMSGGTGGGASGAGGIGGASGVEPTGGMGDAGSSGTSGATSAGMLTIDFTSVGNAGEYAPRNVGAVWIETGSGTFVKTLARWAGVRAGHLTRWTQASGGWGGGFFFATGGGSPDEMDAMTSATLRTHQAHHVTWDMQDVNDTLVPNGTYRIVIEVTESERKASSSAEIEFEKSGAPVALSPSDEGPYSGLSVTYTP